MTIASLKEIINLITILEGAIDLTKKYAKIRKTKINKNYKKLDKLIKKRRKELEKFKNCLLFVLNENFAKN